MALTRLNNRSISEVTALPSGITSLPFNLTPAMMPTGSTLQIKQTVYTNSNWTLGAGTTAQTTLPFNVSITPLQSNSKILITVELRWACINPNFGFGLYRDNGTIQLGDNATDAYGNGWMGIDEAQMGNDDWEMYRDSYTYLDSHGKSVGTEITYDIRINPGTSLGTTFFLNHSQNSAGPSAISSITAMEIAG